MIIEHPEARAGPSLNPTLSSGKFQAKYATATPAGCCIILWVWVFS